MIFSLPPCIQLITTKIASNQLDGQTDARQLVLEVQIVVNREQMCYEIEGLFVQIMNDVFCFIYYNSVMSSRFFLAALVVLGAVMGVRAWCEKTHFFERESAINDVDFSPDRTMVATAGASNLMIVWNFTTLQPIFTLTCSSSVQSAKFSKNQLYIAVGQGSSSVNIIQVSTFTSIFNISTGLSAVNEVDFSWDNSRLLICGANAIQVYEVGGTWTREVSTSNGGTAFRSCKFQKNNQYFGGDNSGNNRIYNTITNTLLWSHSESSSASVAADFDMVNQSLVVATSSGDKILVYPSARWPTGGGTSQTLNRSISVGNSVNSVAFAKEGSIYAVGVSSYLLIYENNTNQLLFNWTSTGSITAGSFSYDSQYYVSGSSSGLLKVFKRMCQACPVGTYELSNTCAPCAAAMPGCLACPNSTYCFTCGDGYAFDSTNKNCTLCHNNITGCVLCNSTAVCTACFSLYYLSGTTCTSCQTLSNCLTCNSSAVCLQCSANFFVSPSTQLCVACEVTNCLSCYNSTACLDCIIGYYVSPADLACLRCPQANCEACNNATVCTQCAETNYLTSNGSCESCLANCLACSSTACTRCLISYYPSGTGCLPCPNPCASCTTASSCSTCVPGYFESSGSCTACSGSCLTCTSSTACLSCNVNYYYLSASNTCNKCQNLLAGCLQCTNTTCLRCETGYYYSGTSCLKCAVSFGCQSCSNSTFCMSCLSGYKLDSGTGVCSLCGVGCSSCYNSTLCINCLPKYYFSSGSCLLCPATCPTCLSAASCLSCVQGYYVNGSQVCLACNGSISNCASCASSAYCTSCELGYRLSATNTSCVKCAWPCSLCNASQCTECATGYYLASGACTICGIACSSCSSSSFCTGCINGFYLTATNTCTSCQSLSAGCSICSQTACLGCLTNLGYYLASGSCSLCSNSSVPNCLQCSNSTTCRTCSFGYYESSGSCSACAGLVSNCQSCTATACLTCMDPYFLSASACLLCAEGCSACYNGTTCKACLTGYLLQSGACTYCDTLMNGCEACSSSTVCTNCADGYVVSGTSCASCSSQIAGCQLCNATNFCTTCMDQYYLSGSSCVKCDAMAGCNQCNSSSVCLSCQTGYYHEADTCSRCADVMCLTCTNSSTCLTCLSGYYASSGSCSQCNSTFPGCVLCSPAQCLQCQSGYFVNASNQCSSCLVSGCEICNVFQPTLCVTCSSLYYLSASSNCVSCSSSMTGCINCLSSTHCLKCMVGSFLASNFSCQSCFSSFNGCGECSVTGCTACQGGYIMNGTACSTCISFIPGCLYCTSTTVCLSCQSGYYQAGNTCNSCGGITGCLDCSSATACNLCSDSYYLNATDTLCYICNSTITGCISCASSTTCKACLGNYALAGGACTALKSTSSEPYTQLRLVTEYKDKNRLLHRLIVKGTFNTQAAVNLTQSSIITMVGASGSSVQLTIYSYEWISQFELNFITNNPIGSNFSSFFRSMPTARLLTESPRLLASNVNLNYQFKLDMTESAIQQILPSADHMGSLSLSSPADNPSFIRSVYTQLPYNYHYFGFAVTFLMLVVYFVKAAVSVPQSDDQGELVSHVFLLRCGGVIFSLTYMEYIDYCYGFLTPDLPWLNLVTAPLAASPDLSPNSYLLFYSDMTIASSYLSALCFLTALALVLLLVAVFSRERREGLKVVGVFLFNFFEVGLIMAGSMSIQGAYYNSLNYITSNTLFYLIGIVLFVVVAVVDVWMAVGSIHRINKIRVLVKTTFLSLLYVSPLYLLPIALGLELIFVAAEYNIKKAVKLHPHLWLLNQVLVNAALVALVLLSDSLLSVLLPSVLVGGALCVDLLIHVREYQHQEQLVKVKEIQKLTDLMETQEKLNRTIKRRNNTIYEKTKMNETALNSSAFSNEVIFNTLDEDVSSSKSPLHPPQKGKASYFFDEPSESKEL